MMPQILPEHILATAPEQLKRLPTPSAVALATSARLCNHICAEIECSGLLSFARFMELALYAPGLGYYAAGSVKFGASGDFFTAPELTPLFAEALSAQIKQLVEQGCDRILELGAGSGKLAADSLDALARHGVSIARYSILEVSAELRARQQETLRERVPQHLDRIEWLDALPERFSGIILGNEVLDAVPVHLIRTSASDAHELGVRYDTTTRAFAWATRALAPDLTDVVARLSLPADYTTEIHLGACGLVRSLAERLERGAILFIDYGFPQREYYHPQRNQGTLMCHYRQHAHADPLILVGLQDITTHLDFTALAQAAIAANLELLGYTSQAQFLINCGIVELLQKLDPADVMNYAPVVSRVQRLLSPAEMGELVKVIAVGRGVALPLLGFSAGDRSGRL